MSNQTKLLIYSLISFVLFLLLLSLSACNNAHQTATTSPQEETTTYTYIITEIDESGLYGDSVTDDTGIFIDQSTIEGMELKENDKISVSFPADDWETITKVTKVN